MLELKAIYKNECIRQYNLNLIDAIVSIFILLLKLKIVAMATKLKKCFFLKKESKNYIDEIELI